MSDFNHRYLDDKNIYVDLRGFEPLFVERGIIEYSSESEKYICVSLLFERQIGEIPFENLCDILREINFPNFLGLALPRKFQLNGVTSFQKNLDVIFQYSDAIDFSVVAKILAIIVFKEFGKKVRSISNEMRFMGFPLSVESRGKIFNNEDANVNVEVQVGKRVYSDIFTDISPDVLPDEYPFGFFFDISPLKDFTFDEWLQFALSMIFFSKKFEDFAEIMFIYPITGDPISYVIENTTKEFIFDDKIPQYFCFLFNRDVNREMIVKLVNDFQKLMKKYAAIHLFAEEESKLRDVLSELEENSLPSLMIDVIGQQTEVLKRRTRARY